MVMNKFQLPSGRLLSRAFSSLSQEVVLWEVLPIPAGVSSLVLTFEAFGVSGRHGVWLACNGTLVIGASSIPSADVWCDTAPNPVNLTVRAVDGNLHLYNIWDKGKGRQSQAWTSGLLVDQLTNGRRYRCNDIGSHGKFDDLTFRIEWET